ncbi:MAG: hypothetical protein NW204_06300 [Xanthomonadaceae bacterium]|nr:hypothetical protein [Xanthomonadaceae bacterium]
MLYVLNRLINMVPVMALVVLGGCANWKSIHRSADIPDSAHAISVDAKQRFLISNKVDKETLKRFCAEPSPDVFSVLASSLGASASAALAPDKNMKLAAQFSYASSENAATIERSQTTNVLREMMYRNCERYLSGGISGDELIIQAARDQRAIISIMAIDHLTGVPRAQATALSAQANASTGGVTAEIVAAYQKAREDARLADEAAQESQQACATEADAAKKQAACKQADEHKKLSEEAKNHESLLQKAIAAMTAASATTAQAVGSTSGALKLPGTDRVLADTVLEIVKETNRFREIEMTCVVLFRNIARNFAEIKSQNDGVLYSGFENYFDKCLGLLGEAFAQIVSEMELQTARNYIELEMLDSELIEADSEMLWSMLSGSSGRLSKAIEVLRGRGINFNPSFTKDIEKVVGDKQSFKTKLGLLSPQQRRELIKALQTVQN